MEAHTEAEHHRLLMLVEQLQREGCSQREIEAAVRGATSGSTQTAGVRKRKRGIDVLLTRLVPLRPWAWGR